MERRGGIDQVARPSSSAASSNFPVTAEKFGKSRNFSRQIDASSAPYSTAFTWQPVSSTGRVAWPVPIPTSTARLPASTGLYANRS